MMQPPPQNFKVGPTLKQPPSAPVHWERYLSCLHGDWRVPCIVASSRWCLILVLLFGVFHGRIILLAVPEHTHLLLPNWKVDTILVIIAAVVTCLLIVGVWI